MLYVITGLDDELAKYLADDPVRPTIPHADRLGASKDVFVWYNEDSTVGAITCASYQGAIPISESELFDGNDPKVAIFYTIWSYTPGAGRKLLRTAVEHIKQKQTNIERFLTLSPKTTMARQFHLRNGAEVFRENLESVNYEYK
jgi:hypothetical protein